MNYLFACSLPGRIQHLWVWSSFYQTHFCTLDWFKLTMGLYTLSTARGVVFLSVPIESCISVLLLLEQTQWFHIHKTPCRRGMIWGSGWPQKVQNQIPSKHLLCHMDDLYIALYVPAVQILCPQPQTERWRTQQKVLDLWVNDKDYKALLPIRDQSRLSKNGNICSVCKRQQLSWHVPFTEGSDSGEVSWQVQTSPLVSYHLDQKNIQSQLI